MATDAVPTKSTTDETLMILYQNGDPLAFEELYHRHAPKVFAYLTRRVPNKEAEDLHQIVFLKVHQYRVKYDPTFPFLAWIFTITRNVLIDHFRKRPAPSSGIEVSTVPDGLSSQEPALDLNKMFATLPPEQRELLCLRFQEGLRFEEISARLGILAPALRKRVSRLVRAIRKFD